MDENQIPHIDVPFRFIPRPEPLPPDLRPDWRVAILLLMLHHSRGHKASLKKLHFLNWGILTPESRKRLLAYVKGEGRPEDIIIGVEPGLIHAFDFAKGEGLVVLNKGTTVKLTSKGESMACKINEMKYSFEEERNFLKEMKNYGSEKNIEAFLQWEKK